MILALLVSKLRAFFSYMNMSPEERFLSQAQDTADLEQRFRIIEENRRREGLFNNRWGY